MSPASTLQAPQDAPSLRAASLGFLISTTALTLLMVLIGAA